MFNGVFAENERKIKSQKANSKVKSGKVAVRAFLYADFSGEAAVGVSEICNSESDTGDEPDETDFETVLRGRRVVNGE
jgi:hypothetical protein